MFPHRVSRLSKLFSRRFPNWKRKVQTDSWSNVPEHIHSKIGRNLFQKEGHPICSLRQLLEQQFQKFEMNNVQKESPIVSVETNFDSLGFPKTHVSRSKSDTYYMNNKTCLRTHTSAHQPEEFSRLAKEGFKKNGFLITADVYRRDEVDSSHYPIFHQMEGALVWNRNDTAKMKNDLKKVALSPSLKSMVDDETTALETHNDMQDIYSLEETKFVSQHLKDTLTTVIHDLVSLAPSISSGAEQVRYRWTYDSFPFTKPSFQLEIDWKGKWLEILGCGVVQDRLLKGAGLNNYIGWAFGIGLERLAMILYGIPDIRLFWSLDERFSKQFLPNKISTFKPFSKYPACFKDISFWINNDFNPNDFYEIIRDVCQDMVESVNLIDQYTAKSGKTSLCYRVNYRSMERSLRNEEIDKLQEKLRNRVANSLRVELR